MAAGGACTAFLGELAARAELYGQDGEQQLQRARHSQPHAKLKPDRARDDDDDWPVQLTGAANCLIVDA